METPIRLSGHVIGLLKEYMRDLVEQAEQEVLANERFGFSPTHYRPDQAISDLLALLDDRIESEGIQVGLPENLLHSMWSICNEASAHLSDQVWLEGNLDSQAVGKTRIRELTYRALIDFIEMRSHGRV
jgi:cell division ATPase FtsA